MPVPVSPRLGPGLHGGLAALRVLDLDDLGAELGQDLGAGRTGLELRQVEDAHPGKAVRRGGGFSHFFLPIAAWRKNSSLPRSSPSPREGREGSGAVTS